MSFSYLDLKNIQQSFFNLVGDEEEFKKVRFLDDICIKTSGIEEMRNALFTMGINVGKVYPELDNLMK